MKRDYTKIIEIKNKANTVRKNIVQFLVVEFLAIRKKFHKKINQSFFCNIFSHSFGNEEYNHTDVKRFEKFGYAQKRYLKKCKFCKKRSFSRVDQLGNKFWEIE